MDVDQLVDDVMTDKVELKSLSMEELDIVIDRLTELGESMLGTDQEEAGIALLNVLANVVDDRIEALEMKAFELAIAEAEARGSTYWELEEHIVH